MSDRVSVLLSGWEPAAGQVVLVHHDECTYEVQIVREMKLSGYYVTIPTTGEAVEMVHSAGDFVGLLYEVALDDEASA